MGTSQAQTLSERDKKFILLAAEGGMMEAQLGQYASQKAESPKVWDLGKLMAGDHSKANEELRGLASRKKTSLPANLSDKTQKEISALKKKKGGSLTRPILNLWSRITKRIFHYLKRKPRKGMIRM